MTRFRLSFSFLLLLLALSSYGEGAGLKPAPKSESSRIAFLVGINSYKATTSLKYAVGDSNAIEDLLLKTGKYDKLIKLTDQGKLTTTYNPEKDSYSSQNDSKIKPTKANIETTYKEVLADNPDMLLFYYSGHGFIEGEGGENYIAPNDVDVKFEKKKVGKEIQTVAVPLNGISLKKMGFDAAKVKKVVFLIDACRSPLPEAEEEESVSPAKDAGKKELTASAKDVEKKNLTTKDTKSTKEAKNAVAKDAKVADEKEQVRKAIFLKSETLPKRVLEAEGITMLIGAAPEVSSLEDEDFKSGIFTHFLKKAFNGGVQEENQEEYITEENLSRYIEDRFKHYYELRKKESESATEPKLYNLTFDRGKKGEILITYHRPIEGKERIDKPIYTDSIRKREVKGKLVYNERGEREDLRFFVHDKKRDLYYPDSLDGVYKMEYSIQKDKAGELENFTATEFNLENQEVFEYGTKLIPDVGWEYRGLYNAGNVETGLRPVFSSNESSVTLSLSNGSNTDKSKIQFEAKIYDFNGNNISEEYFDSNGKPLEFAGVAKTVRTYDKDGQKILEEFYSKETLDEFGDVTEPGKLIAKDGFARYKVKYKSKGNLLYETWEDAEGKVVNTNFGYAKVKYIYDKNDRLIRKKFYDVENKPANDKWGVSVYSYSYDSNCIGMYESKIAEITKKKKGTALTDWKLGKYKLCLSEEIHTDIEGKPADDEKQIYKKIRTFNKKGFLISEENFRADGRRHLDNAVAKVEYSHDKDGNIISRRNFGEFEVNKKLVPVSDGNGVHEYRYTYQEYFSYDGKPILNECMYHRKEKGILIDPYGCALKLEHFGINGKPIEDKRNVHRTIIYYTGTYQEEADKMHYAIDDTFIYIEKKVNFTSNPFGHHTLDADYEMREGALVLGKKYETKYDERNNKTLIANYETKERVEVLVWKSESKYDDRNNKILEAYYKAKEGKLVLINKSEWKYDERNNTSLETNYETKEGALVLVHKSEHKYDARNNKTLFAEYKTDNKGTLVLFNKYKWKYDGKKNKTLEAYYKEQKGKDVLVSKFETKYDGRNNKILEAKYETEEGILVLVRKSEFKYDENNKRIRGNIYERKKGQLALASKFETKYDKNNNKTLEAEYAAKKDGTLVLVRKTESNYDEKNNKILEAYYATREGKEVLVRKTEYTFEGKKNPSEGLIGVTGDRRIKPTEIRSYEMTDGALVLVRKFEFKYDEKNNETLKAIYETKDGALIILKKSESKFDERNNKTLEVFYKTEGGKEVLGNKYIWNYDKRNNNTLEEIYKTKEGAFFLLRKSEYKYDDRNNKTLEVEYKANYKGELVLIEKSEWNFDEKNNKTLEAKYSGDEEVLEYKNIVEYRLESYAAAVTLYKPQIKQIEEKLKQTKNESEKKSLNQKLEDLKKEFETKKKKYTLTEEKYGKNEKLESSSYKLLFFNPRGQAEKRLMRVDLDRFYRPVKIGFEEE